MFRSSVPHRAANGRMTITLCSTATCTHWSHHVDARSENPWFWTITVRVPQYPHDRGYAATCEQAMADFNAACERLEMFCDVCPPPPSGNQNKNPDISKGILV